MALRICSVLSVERNYSCPFRDDYESYVLMKNIMTRLKSQYRVFSSSAGRKGGASLVSPHLRLGQFKLQTECHLLW